MKSKVNIEITGASIWWSWALRHALWLYNRFHKVRDTRRTPCMMMKRRDCSQPVLRFGEQVLARRPGMHLHTAQSQFVFASWVGRDSHTDEHVVLSIGGMFRSRAVKRLTEDKAWNADLTKTIL